MGYPHIYLSLILTLGQEPLLVQYADRIQAEKGRLDQIPEGKHFVILILKLNELNFVWMLLLFLEQLCTTTTTTTTIQFLCFAN